MDNNLLPIDTVSTLSQDFLKVSSVVRIHVDEVHFEIATQGFSAVLIQSVLSGFALFKHDQRCARHDNVVRRFDRLRSLHPNQLPKSNAVCRVDCIGSMLQEKGHKGSIHHRARRRLPHRQAHGSHHRERGRILQRKSCRGRRPGNEGSRFEGLLPRLQVPLRIQVRVKVSDGAKERPTLEIDPAAAPVVKELFQSSLRGNGLMEICKALNDRGVTNRGKRWYKGGLHYLLTNEAYTGAAVWGRTSKGEKAQDPVRVEGAWPALVSREMFDAVQQAMRDRAPPKRAETWPGLEAGSC